MSEPGTIEATLTVTEVGRSETDALITEVVMVWDTPSGMQIVASLDDESGDEARFWGARLYSKVRAVLTPIVDGENSG
jgi:hypothetical protein